MNKILACAVILLFSAAGCFWPFSGSKARGVRPQMDDGVSVEVLSVSALKNVHKIYFEPLSAGADAEAGEALDRLALMIVKGFSDAVGERFILVSGDDAPGADALIRGHIEEFKVRGHIQKKVSMKVRADLRAMSNGEVLALIYTRREFKSKGRNSDQAAYDTGYAVAQKLSE